MPAPARFAWHTIATPDPGAAAAFYRAVLPWTAPARGLHAVDDAPGWCVAGHPAGAFVPAPDTASAQWICYLAVEDLEASALALRAHAATVNVVSASHALASDPFGAVFGLVAQRALPTPPSAGPGSVSWHELVTSDALTALTLYSSALGWTLAAEEEVGAGLQYVTLRTGDAVGVGLYAAPGPSHWLPYVLVVDLDAVCRHVVDHGGTVVRAPMPVPGGRVAVCADPFGARFGLDELRRQAA